MEYNYRLCKETGAVHRIDDPYLVNFMCALLPSRWGRLLHPTEKIISNLEFEIYNRNKNITHCPFFILSLNEKWTLLILGVLECVDKGCEGRSMFHYLGAF